MVVTFIIKKCAFMFWALIISIMGCSNLVQGDLD
jgi:hypothetical protein